MRKFILYSLLFIVPCIGMSQNIGINSNGTAPSASAMLDILSADKGLLIPRVDIVDLATGAPVTSPTTSLLVYNVNVASGVGYYFWDGTKWTKLSDANSNSDHDWYEVGGTASPDNINDNIFTQGKVGIGTISPTMKLEVENGGVKVKTTSGHIVLEDSDQTLGEMTRIERDGGGLLVDLVSTNTALFKILDNGNVGVNTITPTEKLEVQGSVKIVDGTEGAGKGLFSDATGKASWQNTVSDPTYISPVFNTGQSIFSFNTNLTIAAEWGNLRSQKAIVKLRVFFGANGTGYYYDTFAVTLRDSPQIIYASQMPTGGLLDTAVPGSWQVIAWY